MPELLHKERAFSEEEVKIAKEAWENFTDAYVKVAVPFIVFDREEVREKLKKSRDLLDKLV